MTQRPHRKPPASVPLNALNQRLLDYWRSLPRESGLPRFEAFDPAQLPQAVAGIGVFDVIPGVSVTCRIAGTVHGLVLGSGANGVDWLAMTPAPLRQQRLIRYSAVAQGAVGISRRKANSGGSRGAVAVEEVMLPFAAPGEGAPVPVLVHVDWRPQGDEWIGIDTTDAIRLADEFFLLEQV